MNAILKFVFRVLFLFAVLAVVVWVWPGPQLREAGSAPVPVLATRDPMIEQLATSQAQQAQALATIATQLAQPTATPVPVATQPVPMAPSVPANDLVNPARHHADSQPPENGVGSFDVGVKQGQIGLAFGTHIAWPKGNLDAGGNGCDLIILTPGWYENLQVTDGRYEVYDVPSSDYTGWVKVLGQQRADEQAKDYGCPAKSFQDLPQWESPIPSPP